MDGEDRRYVSDGCEARARSGYSFHKCDEDVLEEAARLRSPRATSSSNSATTKLDSPLTSELQATGRSVITSCIQVPARL